MKNSTTQGYKNAIYFSNQGWRSDDFGLNSPVDQKQISENKCATSIVERVVRAWPIVVTAHVVVKSYESGQLQVLLCYDCVNSTRTDHCRSSMLPYQSRREKKND